MSKQEQIVNARWVVKNGCRGQQGFLGWNNLDSWAWGWDWFFNLLWQSNNMKIRRKKIWGGRRKNKRERKKKKKKKKKNNDVTELNYFLLFLNDHASNFRLPRKQFLTELTSGVKLIMV